MLDVGLLVLRVVIGALIAAHGAQKLFGVWGGPGWKGTVGMMDRMHLYPAPFWALVAALAEFGGGLLILFGFLWPLGPLALMAQMIMAIFQVHASKGFWNTQGGFEFPLTLLTVGFVLGLTSPGVYSIDHAVGFALPEPEALLIGLILVAIGILLGLGSHALYRPADGRAPQPAERANQSRP